MQQQMDRKRVIVSNSIYSLVIGIGINTIFPTFAPVAFVFNAIGVGGIGYYAITWSRFDLVFKTLKLGSGIMYPILKSRVKGEYSTVYKFTLPPGLCVEDFKKKQENIEEHIGKKINIEFINKGLFIIEVYHQNKQEFFDYEPTELKGNVPILIGRDRKWKLISFDLAEGTEPHMLIAGGSGCGKSTALRSIITNLILFSKVNLHLIDLKHGAEFSVFKRSQAVKSFAKDLGEAEKVLQYLNGEIERRYAKFERLELNDIQSYNKKYKLAKMPYEVLVIDEMIDFKKQKELLAMLDIISAKARACGIHAIFSTQRPDKDILEGGIKSNVTNVLGMRTKDGVNSRIIIDHDGLEKLDGKGHGILSRLGTETEIQTPYLDVKKARELICHTYIDKQVSAPADKEEKEVIFDITDVAVFKE